MVFAADGAVAFAGILIAQAGKLVATANAIAVARFRGRLDGDERHCNESLRFHIAGCKMARVTFSNGLTRSAPSSRWHTLNKWNVLGSRHGFPGGRVLSFPPSLAGAPGAGGVYPDRVAAHAVFGLSSIFLRRHPTLFRKSIGPQLPQALSIDGLAPHCAPLATSIYPRNLDRIRREQAAGGKLVANEVGGG